MVYLLPCYHQDKLEKHLVSYPIFLSNSPQQLYFSHLFFHLLSSSFIFAFKLCTFILLCVCVCVQSLEKLAHPTISSGGVHFPSVGMSEMNISGWNGAERCILTRLVSPIYFFLHGLRALPLQGENFRPLQVFSGRRHFTDVLLERFLTLKRISGIITSGSAFKVVYCTSRCLHQFEMPRCSSVAIF